MIKAIVFDLGNVLMEFGWERFFHERGYEGEAFERIADATVRSPWWLELDKGTITKEEAVANYIQVAPEFEEEFLGLYNRIDQMLVRYDYALDWLQELRERGYKLYALSNWSKPALEGCAKGLSFLDDLDGAVLSYQEKVIKPNAQIYHILCERYDIRPEEAVFLDDSLPNVIGAHAVGMHGIHFRSYEQGKAELEALLAREG